MVTSTTANFVVAQDGGNYVSIGKDGRSKKAAVASSRTFGTRFRQHWTSLRNPATSMFKRATTLSLDNNQQTSLNVHRTNPSLTRQRGSLFQMELVGRSSTSWPTMAITLASRIRYCPVVN